MPYPVVPEYITVHLGAPDAPAENVTVTFPRYIKGVAASEIYPTWNESAIRATGAPRWTVMYSGTTG